MAYLRISSRIRNRQKRRFPYEERNWEKRERRVIPDWQTIVQAPRRRKMEIKPRPGLLNESVNY